MADTPWLGSLPLPDDEAAARHELARRVDAVTREVSRMQWQSIGADVDRQQTAADSFALGVLCALLALWLAARLSARLSELVPPAADDA